jgi:hypothetical protein
MIGDGARTPVMTLLKLLTTLLAAGLLTFIAMPGFAANGNDGVTNGTPPSKPSDPAAKPRRHRKHDGTIRPHRRPRRDGNPNQAPAPRGTNAGDSDIG